MALVLSFVDQPHWILAGHQLDGGAQSLLKWLIPGPLLLMVQYGEHCLWQHCSYCLSTCKIGARYLCTYATPGSRRLIATDIKLTELKAIVYKLLKVKVA